ncbi:MAG: acetyl-CoA carboxylase biotin carboxyl carrier protein subunit [Fibromonadales bacterium]|nr:acetyl-CoA carboxylase biotin carboxyl carrier protein subunit [Fibromonadales bacterium]
MKTIRITLEGRTYDVGVEVLGENAAHAPVAAAPVAAPVAQAPVAAPPPPQPAAAAPAPTGAGAPVLSPMPGQVMKIKLAVGATVAANQEVMVLEAMKMETPIFAPSAGTIQSISVKEGDAVSESQVLFTIG